MIGLPGETRSERQETRDAIYDWGLDWAFFNYATPLRGSELFRMCKENNWIEEKYLPIGAIDMTEYVITAPGMDRDEIKQTVFDMNLDLNFVNNQQSEQREISRPPIKHSGKWCGGTRASPSRNISSAMPGAHGRRPGQGRKHYRNYRDIIAASQTWRDAAAEIRLGAGSRIREPKIGAAHSSA